MHNEIIFDIETQNWFEDGEDRDLIKLKVSVVAVYSRTLDSGLKELDGKIQSFWVDEIDKLWPVMQNADRIVGYNSINFDTPVLQSYASIPLNKLPQLDIMAEIKRVFGRRIALNAVAKETLGREKLEEGSMANVLWEKGDKASLERLQKYCEEDVMITRDIYDFGLKNKKLKFKDKWNTVREVEVDFSYPEKKEESVQIGLF